MSDQMLVDIANRVHQLMQQSGATQDDIIKHVGITYASLQRILGSMEHSLDLFTIAKLEAYFKQPIITVIKCR